MDGGQWVVMALLPRASDHHHIVPSERCTPPHRCARFGPAATGLPPSIPASSVIPADVCPPSTFPNERATGGCCVYRSVLDGFPGRFRVEYLQRFQRVHRENTSTKPVCDRILLNTTDCYRILLNHTDCYRILQNTFESHLSSVSGGLEASVDGVWRASTTATHRSASVSRSVSTVQRVHDHDDPGQSTHVLCKDRDHLVGGRE